LTGITFRQLFDRKSDEKLEKVFVVRFSVARGTMCKVGRP